MNNYYTNLKEKLNNIKPTTNKHFVPSTRVWKDGIYSYDKNNMKNTVVTDNSLHTLMKIYMNGIPSREIRETSLRFRNSKIRTSTLQTFISDPEIKQTSDETSVGFYVYDRQSSIENKKAFYINKKLSSIVNDITKAKYWYIRRTRNTRRRKLYTYKTNHDIYSSLLYKNLVSNRKTIHTLFTYRFLKWLISGFGFNIILHKSSYEKADLTAGNNTYTSYTLDISLKDEYSKSYVINQRSDVNYTCLLIVNKILITYINILVNNNANSTNVIVYDALTKFRNNYISKIKLLLNKEILGLKNLFKLYKNKVKYGNMIKGMKYLMMNMYGKKVSLNIVKLKYPHLNVDIMMEAVAIKLKRRKIRLLNVLRKAISLVKKTDINSNVPLFKNLNKLSIFKNNTLIDIVNSNSKDKLSLLLNAIYPYESLHFNNVLSNKSTFNVLSALYYKWTTGVRIETRGRLTKRFTASRSMFKYKYRGGLENLEYKTLGHYSKKPLNISVLRNQDKPNIQRTVITEKRRIGLYGIKGWISNN